MPTQEFRTLHNGPIFVMPNPWDVGSARSLASLGFKALATTSAGYANTLGRADGQVSRDESIAHAAEIVQATPLPVNADLEGGYGHSPQDVATTVRAAIDVGLAGGSIEDATGRPDAPIYPVAQAVERIEAAVQAAADTGFVLTARAENFLFGITDLDDTIDRLQRFAAAGADVVYAPGLASIDDIATVVSNVAVPVNVLARPDLSVAQLADAGVIRISLGSALSRHALGAAVVAAEEILTEGTFTFAHRTPSSARIDELATWNG